MTEEEYHQWELEQQEQEEQGQMLNDSLYDEEKERRAGITQAIQSYWKNRSDEFAIAALQSKLEIILEM